MDIDNQIIPAAAEDDALSAKQREALALLILGKTISAAAREVGVGRVTLSRWVNQDAKFRAALNRARSEIHAAHADRMRALSLRAFDVLEELLEPETPAYVRLRAALAVIDAAKKLEKDVGLTSAELIEATEKIQTLVARLEMMDYYDALYAWREREQRALDQASEQQAREQERERLKQQTAPRLPDSPR